MDISLTGAGFLKQLLLYL